MSIWCSHEAIGFDDTFRRARKPHGGQVRSYAGGWSNHYPTTNGKVERRAFVDLASIAPWCVPGHEECEEDKDFDYETCGPWLRLGVNSWAHNYHKPSEVTEEVNATVVLDEAAVRQLVAQLTVWLARPKVQPRAIDERTTA